MNDLLDNELNVVKSNFLRNVKVNKKLKGFYLSKIRENAFKKSFAANLWHFYLSITIFC